MADRTTTTAKKTKDGKYNHNDGEYSTVVGGGSFFSLEQKSSPEEEPKWEEDSITHFNARSETAHLLHALVGLERYPNYLSRWSYNLIQDVENLESALEEQLEKVRNQKERLLARTSNVRKTVNEAREAELQHDQDADINENEDDWNIFTTPKDWEEVKNILDSRCANAIFQSKMFRSKDKRPSLDDVLSGKIVVELDEAQCEEWLDQEMYDVYSFPLLLPSFCMKIKRVMKRLIQYQSQKAKTKQTNSDGGKISNIDSLGKRPLDLDLIGASWINSLLFHLVIRPLSKHLFRHTETMEDLDWRHGYIVGYSDSPSEAGGAQRQRLIPHTDDSEVTLNVGMGDDFEGGDLAFWGLRNSKDEGNFVGQFHPIIGTAVLHAGR